MLQTTSAERMRLSRQRRRQGKHPIRLLTRTRSISCWRAATRSSAPTTARSPRRSLLTSLIRSWRAHERRCPRTGRGQSAEPLVVANCSPLEPYPAFVLLGLDLRHRRLLTVAKSGLNVMDQ
jgi:hypothetical protein